jgi:hypothetical protein
LLFRSEVNSDFGLKELSDLGLPHRKISLANGRCAINPNAQHQGMLMLAREWNQISIA